MHDFVDKVLHFFSGFGLSDKPAVFITPTTADGALGAIGFGAAALSVFLERHTAALALPVVLLVHV